MSQTVTPGGDGTVEKIKSFFTVAGRMWNGFSGADKYHKYLAHHRATGCEHEPMTEREFWRDYTDRQDKNPEGRCC
ncbi:MULTISPECIES: YbdD/YjiX family protein [unclassified Rothia (in: high G+C Gram-positive bacteria)]|uniref:YbdD/YjiX family protein n=1 Tax=unclassified Rothia (in: high G+C Gram-positive bacteria) TaxID=2689056 RepID=UPI0019568B3B|nr:MULTISPECIES: YbdD/YjiX family protein [unclassified Rothia (in: high G+C Gram-positive bacteria)]MBM7051560.1 YbdD/YjiX family protein [Rothia sp. ZJ1223]QRZ61848.1 YbdD/YjiX family protein [Rothia sp. ZJ932]